VYLYVTLCISFSLNRGIFVGALRMAKKKSGFIGFIDGLPKIVKILLFFVYFVWLIYRIFVVIERPSLSSVIGLILHFLLIGLIIDLISVIINDKLVYFT